MFLYQCGFCKAVFPLNTIFKYADLEAALKDYVLQFTTITTCTPGEISLEADPADTPSIEEPTFEITDWQGNHICDFRYRSYELEDVNEDIIVQNEREMDRLPFKEFLQERGDAWHRLITSKCFICNHFQFKFNETSKQCWLYCKALNEYWSLVAFNDEYESDYFGDDCEQFCQKRPSQLKEYLDNIRAGKVILRKPLPHFNDDELSFILNLDSPVKEERKPQ